MFPSSKTATRAAQDELAALRRSFDSALKAPASRALAKTRESMPAVLKREPAMTRKAQLRAARRLNRASGVLAASVLTDSAMEHYRGAFANKAMFTPLVTSSLALAASIHGTADKRVAAHRFRDSTYALAALTGVVGTGFHIYNIGKRPGGFSWLNFFYAAPVGAPMALALSGMLGVASERVRDTLPGRKPTILGAAAGRAVGLITSAGLAGTVGEVGLLHFRGNFQNPLMYLPVVVPPVAAVLIGRASLGAARVKRRATRWFLRATALLGFVGTGLHAYGVSRHMGGWRNWTQNLIDGPPVPTPPSFSGLALAGLAALTLLEDHPDD